MSARTFDAIQDDVNAAIGVGDAVRILECVEELLTLESAQARALANRARGIASRLHGDYASALEHLHQALHLYEELGDQSDVGGVIGTLGIVYRNTGNYPTALEYFNRALALHEERGDVLALATTLGNIGLLHSDADNHSQALDYYQRALKLHEDLKDTAGIARVTGNIGLVHDSTGDHDLAIQHFARAVDLHTTIGHRLGVAMFTGNIVTLHIRTGRLDEAEQLLSTMEEMHINDPGTRITMQMNRAAICRLHGDIASAKHILEDALQNARTFTLPSKQIDIHQQLRDLCQLNGDFPGYIEHNNEYTRITEEINGKETATKLAMHESQRRIDAHEKEHAKHMAVLHSTLPKHVADRVARGEVVNDTFDNASVIFLDIVGFTELSSQLSSQEVIALLDDVFTQCDAICAMYTVTKIKTIGDSYMCVSFDSATDAARCALDFLQVSVARPSVAHQRRASASHEVLDASHEVEFRIGLHIGPVVAGVLGTERLQYDVWGDTVNVASRMESSGEAGRVHVSEAFALNLEEALVTRHSSLVTSSVPLVTSHSSLVTFFRGSIDIKGKGPMKTYWLERSV